MLHANLLSVFITLVALLLCFVCRHRLFKDFDVFIRRMAFLVFIGGFTVYFIGYREGVESIGTRDSWFASLFRPLLSSVEMFAFKSDILEIGEECKRSMLYMTIFATIHFAAASVSFAVAIRYMGLRIKSVMRWNALKWRKRLKGDVEVFFGINDVSLRMAYDIHQHHPDDVIVFIKAPESNSNQGMLGFASIFNFFSFRREIMAEVDQMNAIIRQVRRPVEFMKGNDILEQIGLVPLLNKTKSFMGFYFLYDEQVSNISKTIKLRTDNYFKEDMDKKAYIFCRATSGMINGGTGFEYNSKYGVETVLVDASQLSVKSMMSMPKVVNGIAVPHQYLSHPVNFIDIDKRLGLATSAFHCMSIGFGETGQEAFKFIYEHGQFIYPDDFKGAHMVCHIVDPKANNKQGFFEMRYPCLRKENHLSSLNVDIQWHNHTAGDGKFWDLMQNIINDLNYVVIATGSDNRNIAIAYDLCEYALRWRKQKLKNFGIFVRSHNYLNESRYDVLEQNCRDANETHVVHAIGRMSQTFSHNYVWNNYLERNASIFSNSLENVYTKPFDQIYNPNIDEAYLRWWKRHAAVKGEPKAYALVKRVEYQEFSSALHVYTKMHLLGLDDPDDPIGQENRKLIESHPSLEELTRIPFFCNLTKQEHLRYLASHECTGYTPMSLEDFYKSGSDNACDTERHKLLNLVAWEELDNLPIPQNIRNTIPDNYKDRPYRYLHEMLVRASLAVGLYQDRS